MDVLVLGLCLAQVLLIWFNTDGAIEYLTLMGLGTLFRVDEYKKLKEDGFEGLYVDFLKEFYYDKFFVRLVTCPICLATWLGLLFWLLPIKFLAISSFGLLIYWLCAKLM